MEMTLEDLKKEMYLLELEKYDIENNYVIGKLSVKQIDHFKDLLFKFRDILYVFQTTEENLLDIAKMKSKVQHFNTQILEDEDILKSAYDNLS
jgi:hypothetical protein